MIGIPDGLGATKGKGNTTLLYMNHELRATALSEPNVGGPLNKGGFISEWTLDSNGCVISGQRAYNKVVDEEFGVTLPAAEVGNTGRPFGRFCSGSLSYREAGFDRPIYLTGEESGGLETFDGRGGLGVAVFDGELHTLVKMGRFAWENTLARPDAGEYTVVMGMEDGPATLDNQLYMYVGKKNRAKGASVLSRNGLDTDKNTFYFVTTGSGAANVLGRAYQVKFDKKNILGTTTIEVLYNGDTIAAAGGDIGFAPDNMEASEKFLMIQEDGTSQSRPQYASRAREGSIWRHSIRDGFAAKRVVELNPPGTVAVAGSLPPAVLPGVWETSGIIDTSKFFGQDSWLFVVQAHSPSIAPVPNSIEDGQLLIMRPTCKPDSKKGCDDRDDD